MLGAIVVVNDINVSNNLIFLVKKYLKKYNYIYIIIEMVEFTEKEQEEIINTFLDVVNINETEIAKKELGTHNFQPVELFHLRLPRLW